jgi:hypothetical protein
MCVCMYVHWCNCKAFAVCSVWLVSELCCHMHRFIILSINVGEIVVTDFNMSSTFMLDPLHVFPKVSIGSDCLTSQSNRVS